MNSLEFTACVVELWPSVFVSAGVTFCVGLIFGFVLHSSIMRKGCSCKCEK